MVKLLLNPSLRRMSGEEEEFLISEVDYYAFPREDAPLLDRLQEPTDIDDIAPSFHPALRRLADLRLLVNSNLNELPEGTASYWLAKHYYPGFVRAQLDLSIEFIGPLAARYRAQFSENFPECTVVDAGGRLAVYVTNNLLQCDLPDDIGVPVVLMKVGGVKQSIGPVLSPAFTYSDLLYCINRPFDADLSVQIPAGMQATADNLLLTELYHLRVQAGMHLATSHVVEWNLARLTKKFWKVKP